MKIALIITTYNNPDYLELCLKSVIRQKRQPDEIIIADDGSREPTRSLIEKMKAFLPQISHVWHEDNGYQRAKILNLAISKSQADYIITTDQDCILHKKFIKDHELLAEKNCLISAYRNRILEGFTTKILASKKLPDENSLLVNSRINAKYSFRIKAFWAKKIKYEKVEFDGTFGCNMSFWKSDIIKVNGFNEDFIGWGPEDSELTLRIMNTGVVRKKIYYAGIAFHLHHVELSREMLAANKKVLADTLKNKSVWAINGVDKYLMVFLTSIAV